MEFFAGGGMARIAFGERWHCAFSNEICEKKAASYRLNHHVSDELVVDDINNLKANDLPIGAQLAWASFPCQDLSLAGNGVGLDGERSGTFWAFRRLMGQLKSKGHGVPIIVLENVVGALSSNKGEDFLCIAKSLSSMGYKFGAMVLNAVYFLPQSRPRLFIIAVKKGHPIPNGLIGERQYDIWNPMPIQRAYENLPKKLQSQWLWWNLPLPDQYEPNLLSIIQAKPTGVRWHTENETKKLLDMMTETNRVKVRDAQSLYRPIVGTIYKRTRKDSKGVRRQRAEVRFDQISGCLRTPAGGSSRQIVIVVNGNDIKTRLLSPREAARLMGLEDSFQLPSKYNEAYHLLGDGLAVPVVSWLERHILYPTAKTKTVSRAA